jgi:hypothetical protein
LSSQSFSVKPFSSENYLELFHADGKSPLALKDISNSCSYIDGIFDLLNHHGTKSMVIEQEYFDKDFISDYVLYYSRNFRSINRFSKRIHFFDTALSEHHFEDLFMNYSKTNESNLR